jgi:hypothetical protein
LNFGRPSVSLALHTMAEQLSNRITRGDWLTAELLSLGSAAVNVIPSQLNPVGRSTSPSYVPVRWRHLRQPAADLTRSWVHFEGRRLVQLVTSKAPESADTTDQASLDEVADSRRWWERVLPAASRAIKDVGGNLPRNYPLAAIIRVDREAMDRLRGDRPPSTRYDATAYRLGSTSMVGYNSDRLGILGLEHSGDADYQIAMRIGKGPLDAVIGTIDAPGTRISIFRALEMGVRAGPTMPIAEVPGFIPLV